MASAAAHGHLPQWKPPLQPPRSPAAGPSTSRILPGSCHAVPAPSCGTEPAGAPAMARAQVEGGGGGLVPPRAHPRFQAPLFCLPIFANLNKRGFQPPPTEAPGARGRWETGVAQLEEGRRWHRSARPSRRAPRPSPHCATPPSPFLPLVPPGLTYRPARIYSPSVCCEK